MEKLEDFDAMFLYSMLKQNWLVGSVDSMVTETLWQRVLLNKQFYRELWGQIERIEREREREKRMKVKESERKKVK